jgi:hypothetical protein
MYILYFALLTTVTMVFTSVPDPDLKFLSLSDPLVRGMDSTQKPDPTIIKHRAP